MPDEYLIEVVNNGKKMAEKTIHEINGLLQSGFEDTRDKIGLINVYGRLQLFYENRVSMNIFNNPEAGVTVSIRLKRGLEDVSDADC